MSSKAEIVAPLSNRVYFFNFFEKNSMEEKEFHDFWADTAHFVQPKDHFISTHLHRALGSKSKFVWVNFAVFDSNDICIFGKPDPEWGKRMADFKKRDLTSYPGEYHEISSYNGCKLTDSDKTRPEDSRFLLTAVLADDSVSNEQLEANWTSKMKTGFIHGKLGSNPALKDSVLYKVVNPRIPRLRYVVRTELSSMDEKEGVQLAETVQAQPNADGVETNTGFYKVYATIHHKKE